MNIVNRHFFQTFFLVFLSVSLHAQLTSKEVDKLVTEALEKFDVAGAAVGIVKDGKIVHAKGYGVKSIKTNARVDKHTQFSIASNSKAFTTTALAILVEEGKLSWQDKVIDHIPEFTMYNAYVTESFNIQDLITHRSGLGLGIGDLMIFPEGADFTMEDILKSFQHFKPQSAFRTKFDYDNLLYLVAGEIIYRVSGTKWSEFVKKRIIEPLEMDNTYSSISQIKDKSNLATPHSTETGIMRTIPHYPDMINGAAASIMSNVDDLCNWMLVNLNEGKYGKGLKKELFSEASLHEIWKIHTTLGVDRNPRYNSHFSGYGLGWFLTDVNGNMKVSHTGGMPGMLSKTTLIPDIELGVVILTNTSNGGAGVFSALSNTIVDSYLGLDDYQWTEKIHTYFQNKTKEGDAVTSAVWETIENATKKFNTKSILGIYEDVWFGKVEVFMKDEQLWFKSYRSPKLNGPMYYYQANTFAIKWEYTDMHADAFAMFCLDENGKGNAITMKGISPNIDFSFDFQDLDFKRVAK